jgi:hypothetical protein
MAIDWSMVLFSGDLQQQLGELAPTATTFRFERRRGGQIKTMTLPHNSPGAKELQNARQLGRVAVAAYRHDSIFDSQGDTPEPRFCGWLAPVQDDLQGDDPAVSTLQWMDPLGIPFDTSTTSDVFTATPSGLIVATLVNEEAADAPSGLAMGTLAATPARDRSYVFTTLSSAIYALGDLGDFDMQMTYLDPTSGFLAALSIIAPGGADRSSTVRLEAGDGTRANVLQISRTIKPPTNKMTATVRHGAAFPGDPREGELVAFTVSDIASIRQWGKWESVQAVDAINDADLGDQARVMLQPDPIESCVFTPDPATGPQPWVDFWIPDTLGFLADVDELHIDTAMPVLAVEIDLDENMQETAMRFEYGAPTTDLQSLIGQLAERVFIVEHEATAT